MYLSAIEIIDIVLDDYDNSIKYKFEIVSRNDEFRLRSKDETRKQILLAFKRVNI